MNRIQLEMLPTENELPADGYRADNTSDAATAPDNDCAIFAPLHYESKYSYPLLVWLHREGENEFSLKRVMPDISMRNYVVVAPRGTCQLPSTDLSDGEPGYTWCQTQDEIHRAQQRILQAVDDAQRRFNIHPSRIFVAGAGCGGTMAFRVAMNNPRVFRGVVSLGGPFPTNHAPMVRLLEARRLPLFVASARQSQHYPQAKVCSDLRLFHTAGMVVTLRQYPGTDQLNELVLGDVDRWIMEVIADGQEASIVAS